LGGVCASRSKAGACAAITIASTGRFAGILGADVAGYSRLIGTDEEESLAQPTVDPKIVELVRFRRCSKVCVGCLG